MNIIERIEPDSKLESIVKWAICIDPTTDLTGIPDGIYPFNGLTDQWAVVIGEQAVNWAPDYGRACIAHIEAMWVKREHVTRNPANGLGSWWTVRTGDQSGDYTARVDRETGEISYEDC